MIVVLHTPSVAQRLAKVRYATEAQERRGRRRRSRRSSRC